MTKIEDRDGEFAMEIEDSRWKIRNGDLRFEIENFKIRVL